jgi:phosphoglycolate phosphatase
VTSCGVGDFFGHAGALLLDFDGPVCSVFAGLPALAVAAQLRAVLAQGGHELPAAVTAVADPFDVLAYATTLGGDEARCVEAAFAAREVDAIATARPTPGAHDLMAAWHATGRPLTIVSNNSAQAINAYLDRHNLHHLVTTVAARTGPATPLKPDPHLVRQALEALSAAPHLAVLIGDSTTDITAATTAGTRSIGYANKPGKHQALTAAGATTVVTTLTDAIR